MDDKHITRFWHKVDVDLNNNACWKWNAYTDKYGYGRFSLGRITAQAHRVAYIINRGDIPDGMQILHKCDNPPCVNPNHLFSGTNLDNVNDKVRKGRQYKAGRLKGHDTSLGHKNGMSKLTDEDVIKIKFHLKEDILNQRQLSEIFNVSEAQISRIKSGKRWSHLNV